MTANKKSKTEGRLFAIGDIHGCPDELAAVLKSIAPTAGDTVVFVGDYVDRGPSARDVIEIALDLENYGESFLFNGGIATLDSYGVREEDLENAFERLPDAHLGFMTRLATSYLRPPYLFVHAGIMPTRQLEEQQTEDMLWIRQEFIFNPHKIDATVVFGHTPMRGVMIDLPYKLGIDTGLVYGGKLTCVEFTEGVLYQVQRGHKTVKTRSIPLR